jgi:hypothetical protein
VKNLPDIYSGSNIGLYFRHHLLSNIILQK